MADETGIAAGTDVDEPEEEAPSRRAVPTLAEPDPGTEVVALRDAGEVVIADCLNCPEQIWRDDDVEWEHIDTDRAECEPID